MPQIIVYCTVVSDDIKQARRLEGDSPAGTRKVLEMCKAFKEAGVDVRIVSMGRGKVGKFGWYGAVHTQVEGIPITYAPMLHVRYVSYVVTIIWLAYYALKFTKRQRQQVNLFYNQYTFYLLALIVLWVLRRRIAVDIEDGFIASKKNKDNRFRLRFGAEIPSDIFGRFVNSGALVANSFLESNTHLRPVLRYYGAIKKQVEAPETDTDLLQVLISGTLEHVTGLGLLSDAVQLLDAGPYAHRIRVTVTGQGSLHDALLRKSAELNKLELCVLGRVSSAEYQSVLRQADVGLSLRILGHAYSDATFPSKVIEYAENGLLIVTTDVSDVRAILQDTAWYISQNDALQIASLLEKAASDPRAVRAVGKQAQQVVEQQFLHANAGAQLRSFFFPPAELHG